MHSEPVVLRYEGYKTEQLSTILNLILGTSRHQKARHSKFVLNIVHLRDVRELNYKGRR